MAPFFSTAAAAQSPAAPAPLRRDAPSQYSNNASLADSAFAFTGEAPLHAAIAAGAELVLRE